MKKHVIISVICVLIASFQTGCTVTITPKTEAASSTTENEDEDADTTDESSSSKSSSSKSSSNKSSSNKSSSDKSSGDTTESADEDETGADEQAEDTAEDEDTEKDAQPEISAAKYDMGEDAVDAVPAVVGERKCLLSDSGKSTYNNAPCDYWEYTYASDTVSDDLNIYLTCLSDDYNYVNTTGIDLYQDEGSVQFAVESKERGKIILMDGDWVKDSFHLKFTRVTGNLNRYE